MHIETVSGKLVNVTNPLAEDISITDIAWALSRIPRFAGHTITSVPYNVAQHSIYVATLVEKLCLGQMDCPEYLQHALDIVQSASDIPLLSTCALFHDAHEAYTGDIPSPIKRIPELNKTIKIIEARLDHAIFSRLTLPEPSATEKLIIKYCDKLAQAIEGYQFMPSRGLNWDLPKPDLILIQQFPSPLEPIESYKAFLDHFEYLNHESRL